MRPVLINLGSLEIHSWGVMVATRLVLRSELRRRLGRGDVADSIVLAAAGGLLGSRLWSSPGHRAPGGPVA